MEEQKKQGLQAAPEIEERLRDARRAWRRAEVGAGLLRGATWLLAALLAGIAADNLFALPGWLRTAYGVAFLGGVAYVLCVNVLYNLVRPLTDEMVAVHLERVAPGMDNRLINTVLFRKQEFKDALTRRMAASQMDETLQAVKDVDPAAAGRGTALRAWGVRAGALAAGVAVYAVVFTGQFSNALHRYAQPGRFIAPVTRTVLTVTPGNADVLQGDSVEIEAHVDGVLPEKAYVNYEEEGGAKGRQTMPFEGSLFSYKFTAVQRSFRYSVTAGDAVSDVFAVSVKTRPTVKDLRVTVHFPDYMRLPDRTESGPAAAISAPVGATVKVEAVADRALSSAVFVTSFLSAAGAGEPERHETPMTLSPDGTARVEFKVARSGHYQVCVKDISGVANQPVLGQLAALPDDPPIVKLIDPARDLAVDPEAKVTLLAEARDDFNLHSLTLFTQLRADASWEKRRVWEYKELTRQAREGCVLDLKDLGLTPGNVLSYCFKGDDGKPGRDDAAGRSRVYQVAVIDKAAAQQKEKAQQEAFRALVTRLIAQQKSNLDATAQLAAWAQGPNGDLAKEVKAKQTYAQRASSLLKAQEEIYLGARDGVRSFAGIEAAELVQGLASIASREMVQAMTLVEALKGIAANDKVPPAASAAQAAEQQVAAALEKLLTDPKGLLADRLKDEMAKDKLADDKEDLNKNKPKVEKLRDALKEFAQEQREAVKLTKQLAETPPSDFTKEDEKDLNKVLETEAKWAKFFQENATDLSKLPPQDFSIPNLAKEMLEVFSEIKKAEDAMKAKATEIAVPLEQSGLELAKSIETNIEKWLAETPDREAWKMEDPTRDYDVPLADLPDELEDMIGDLMEEEENLMEDAADATSGWLDSMDKGVGWDAMDGPIANMSAKGVTGNRLPDSHEIGGRSGEGRTGKSSGQFVEETATGKGGRKTPTRLTQDPFEAGVVKDTSAEPATGSTGGGKSSGFGAEGFRGQPPPRTQMDLKRMANQQQQLIDKAERLDYGLKKLNYPRGELPKAIEMMKQVKSDLSEGRPISTAGASQKVLLSNLKEIKDVVERQKQVNRDTAALVDKKVRDEVSASLNEEVPKQYKDMVEGDFRTISEAGAGK